MFMSIDVDKGAKNTPWRKNSQGQLGNHMQKNEVGPLLSTTYKN